MPMNEDQKKRFIAIVRQLKKQKGITLKQSELVKDLNNVKQAQERILKVKEEYKDEEVVQREADKEYKKLQEVANNLNDYMKVLHPEGLLDFGTGAGGQAIVGQG
jgi:uncharacterized membrane-anchored protein YjiN (DUF445 family)